MNFKKILHAFIIGSSIISTIITFSYIGKAFSSAGRPSNIPYEWFPILIPILFGIFNILNVIWLNPVITGMLMGLTLSILGRGLNLPNILFGYTKKNEYQVHIIAVILYSLIFKYIINNINILFEIT